MKKFFINKGINQVKLINFIKKNFSSTQFSEIKIQKTPLGTKIIIYANNPGRIIGKGGAQIRKITEEIKTKFEIENPELDIRPVENPDLNAKIIAKQIASALERGYNYKKIGNLALKRIMDAGAVGAEIRLAGKLAGKERGRIQRFVSGNVKHCGEIAKRLVDEGYAETTVKLGKIGITVKIMKNYENIIEAKEEKLEEELIEKPPETEEEVEEVVKETSEKEEVKTKEEK